MVIAILITHSFSLDIKVVYEMIELGHSCEIDSVDVWCTIVGFPSDHVKVLENVWREYFWNFKGIDYFPSENNQSRYGWDRASQHSWREMHDGLQYHAQPLRSIREPTRSLVKKAELDLGKWNKTNGHIVITVCIFTTEFDRSFSVFNDLGVCSSCWR